MPKPKEKYRRVLPRFWGETRKTLTRDEKLVALYLFTNEHYHPAGIDRLPPLFVELEAGVPEDEFLEMMRGPLASIATYDEATEEVFVHRMADHQIGLLKGKDQRIKWVENQVMSIRSDDLRRRFRAFYEAEGWELDYESIAPEGASQGASYAPLNTNNDAKNEGASQGPVEASSSHSRSSSHRGSTKPLATPPVTGRHEGELTEEVLKEFRLRDRATVLTLWHLGRDTVMIEGKKVSMGLEMHIRDGLVGGLDVEEFSDTIHYVRITEEFKENEPVSLRLIEQRPEVWSRMRGAMLKDRDGKPMQNAS